MGMQMLATEGWGQTDNAKCLLQYDYASGVINFIRTYPWNGVGHQFSPVIYNDSLFGIGSGANDCNIPFAYRPINITNGNYAGTSYNVPAPTNFVNIGPYGASSPRFIGGTNPCITTNGNLIPNIVN
jgi:hypothetical protein